MGPRSGEKDWSDLPEDVRRKQWSAISKRRRAEIWKDANNGEKQAIADITSEDLNELSAMARRLPNKSERQIASEQGVGENDSEQSEAKFELKRIHRERVETELGAIREGFSDYR